MEGQVIWITGLSGSGKTTVAETLRQQFIKLNLNPILLDGDILRENFKKDDASQESYTRKERVALSRQYSLLCKNLSSQGFTVIVATISMFNEIYSWNRINLPNYFEIYLNVPMQELKKRDPKNIYKRFASGYINNVAGLDLQVDQPSEAHMIVRFKEDQTKEQIVDSILQKLALRKIK